MPPLFVEVIRNELTNFLWRDLYQRRKRVVPIDVSEGTESFWRRVLDEALTVGPQPIVLVPYSLLGEEIHAAAQPLFGRKLTGFDVSHIDDMPSGGGTGYMGTIEGVHVYSANVLINKAVLCSGRQLRMINYGVVHGESDIVDFSFVDGEDLEKSRVRLKFAQGIEWAKDEFVELQITGS